MRKLLVSEEDLETFPFDPLCDFFSLKVSNKKFLTLNHFVHLIYDDCRFAQAVVLLRLKEEVLH